MPDWPPGALLAVPAHLQETPAAPYQLLLYPKHHLDSASLLACQPLKQPVLAADSMGPYLLLAFAPLELRLLRVSVDWVVDGSRGRTPVARLMTVRELSIMGMGNPVLVGAGW